MASVSSQLPSFVKEYLGKSENRFNQFTVGWTQTQYIPEDDDLFTNTVFEFSEKNKNKKLTLTGIDKTQKSYNIDKKANEMFIDDETLQKLQKTLNGELDEDIVINNNEFKLYSSKSKEINIPIVANEQAMFNMGDLRTKSLRVKNFLARRLIINDEKGTNIPNNAWVYDDRDWLKFRPKDEDKENVLYDGFLDPFSLDVAKFTMARTFDYEGDLMAFDRTTRAKNISKRALGFANVYWNANNDLKTEIRPYYNFDNLFLYIPKTKTYEKLLQKVMALSSVKKGWYGIVKKDDGNVPNKVLKGWEKALEEHDRDDDKKFEKFYWFRPYSRTYDPLFDNEQSNNASNLEDILTPKKSFFWQSMLGLEPFISDGEIPMYKDLKINLVPISRVDIYGSSLLLADQGVTNLLHGYSTSKYLPYNYKFEKAQKGSYKLKNGFEIKTFDWFEPEELLGRDMNDQIWGNKELSKSKWFTGIMSRTSEPYFLTSQASFSKAVRTGEYTLNGGSKYHDDSEIKNIEFLTKQKALINQVATLVLTISTLFIVVIIITSTLSMVIITDLYVNQYKKFMIVMKSLGYSNWKVIKYTFGAMGVLGLIAMAVGIFGSTMLVLTVGFTVKKNIGAIPIGISWWVLLVSSLLILSSFVLSIAITTRKLRKESPVSLLR